jgi:hypothetical protein
VAALHDGCDSQLEWERGRRKKVRSRIVNMFRSLVGNNVIGTHARAGQFPYDAAVNIYNFIFTTTGIRHSHICICRYAISVQK